MIPKIIHYCWFGGGELNPLLKACIKSWNKLKGKGYLIKRWDETNCDISENAYVKAMYDQKKYAFVSDYFRLKALYHEGGIYLDTDVYVYKSFDDLLGADLFLGYIYDCALGTAVIGASKGSRLIKTLLDHYLNTTDVEIVNNGLLTELFYNEVPGFILNGKRAQYVFNSEKIDILPKEEFETGKVLCRSYTLHFADGSWHAGNKKTDYKFKILCCRLPINLMALRQQKKADAVMKKDGLYQQLYYFGKK